MDPLLLAMSWDETLRSSGSIIVNLVALALVLAGILGTFLPMVPGPMLIFIGGLVHYLGMEEGKSISLTGVIVLAVLFGLALLVDNVAGAVGAKWFGATKWGMIGAIVGGIVGVFINPLIGLFLGPLLGAFAFEVLFAEQDLRPATRSTWGAVVGTAAGIFFKGLISLAMLIWLVGDLWFW